MPLSFTKFEYDAATFFDSSRIPPSFYDIARNKPQGYNLGTVLYSFKSKAYEYVTPPTGDIEIVITMQELGEIFVFLTKLNAKVNAEQPVVIDSMTMLSKLIGIGDVQPYTHLDREQPK